MASKKGIIMTMVVLGVITAASFLVWTLPQSATISVSDYGEYLDRAQQIKYSNCAKEFAVPAQLLGEKAMFIGKRDPDDFTRLFGIYIKDYVKCSTCGSPDTKIEKENRIPFLICEACGAKSTMKGKYA